MNILLQDIRFGFRMLVKNVGFTTIAVVSLALGIGASTAVFSLVNGIFLSSLPVPNPQELRVIEWLGTDPKFESFSGCIWEIGPHRNKANAVSYPAFENLRQQCAEQADIFGYAETRQISARARREAFSAEGLMVTDNFFSALQARPLIGQLFTPEYTTDENTQGVVITYPWWERQFDLDLNVLGQSITLNGHSFTIIGVLPQGFPGVSPGRETDFYVSMAAQPQFRSEYSRTSFDRWWVQLMARKKPGVSDTQFQAAFDVAFANVTSDIMKDPQALITDGRGGTYYQRDFYKKPLLLLLSIVGVVMLVVCANLAGLLLARGAARQQEFSVRAAVGAGRWRMIQQTLTENLLLCIIGSSLGLLFALWGKDLISRLLSGKPDGLHYDTALDLKVLGFTLAVTVLTTLLSGLLPALRAAFTDPLKGLKSRTLAGSLHLKSGRTLVVAQIALSLLLLTGAGLYVRTLMNLVQINPGFGMENLLLIQVDPSNAGLQGNEIVKYFEHAQTSLAAIPGVHSAALTQYALLGGWMSGGGFFTLPNYPNFDGPKPNAHRLTVSESFFTTLNIPLLIGREFNAADTENAPKVVMVNETFVHQNLPDGYPIGQILRVQDTDWQIIGVCADAKYTDIKGDVPPTVYYSFRQDPINRGFLALRTALPPAAIVKAARETLAKLNPNVPLVEMVTQKQVRDEKIAQEWMFAILCSALAILAVLLACMGLYGLMAYNVTQRTSEIGIRMALGATGRRIAGPILRDAMLMAAAGSLLGGLGALAVTRLIQNQLYGVTSTDPVTFTVAILAIFFLSVFACYLPARRASKVDPMIALRCE